MFRCFLPALLLTSLFSSTVDAANLGDCYQAVEAMHQAMEEMPVEEAMAEKINAKLSTAVDQCEGEKVEAGMHTLIAANELYNHAVLRGIFWKQARYWWGQNLSHEKVKLQEVKLDCDTLPDMVGWKLDLDNPEGYELDILAVSERADGSLHMAYASLPYNHSAMGMCSMEGKAPAMPEVGFDETADADYEAIVGAKACPQLIRVDDRMCDQIRLAWPKDAEGDEVELLKARLN